MKSARYEAVLLLFGGTVALVAWLVAWRATQESAPLGYAALQLGVFIGAYIAIVWTQGRKFWWNR